MQDHRQYKGEAPTSCYSYDLVPVTAYAVDDLNHHRPPFFHAHGSKQGVPEPLTGPTTSASSSSPLQMTNHGLSTMSSTSGTSAQSADSSADVSPHAFASHPFSRSQKSTQPLYGIDLVPNVVDSDLEQDMTLEDPNFQHFVGEFRHGSLMSRPRTALPTLCDIVLQENLFNLFTTSVRGPIDHPELSSLFIQYWSNSTARRNQLIGMSLLAPQD